MTGDSMNYVPALKVADIGLEMGSETKIAQEAAKVTLAADSLSTIV
jgi:cation transport ATPase